MHFGSGLFQKALAAPLRTHDLNGVTQLHPELEAGDVLLGDRAFSSFGHLACLVLPERISFIDALRWLATAQPGDELPDLVVLTSRPGRVEPRVRKRRPKKFPLMKRPRAELRKALLSQALTP